MLNRIALTIVLALCSMGGCNHNSACGGRTTHPPEDKKPVTVPAPAAGMLAVLGVSIVLTRRRKP